MFELGQTFYCFIICRLQPVAALINTYSGSFRGKLTAECVMQLNVVDDKCLFGR